ncbi:YCF48-related protein [Flavobacterium sp. N3904]|uniref:YCF48-related protein n=1 Tax=Flavobacterium sp. N3904 TaxID=2986835 RepID=UPI002224F752|nr:YCF48-related protein [Flavobacterium sp. N3904]
MIQLLPKKRITLKFLLIAVLLSCISRMYSQNTWELLNPKPSYKTGKEIHFTTGTTGYIINENELLETTNSGISWQKKQDITSANDLKFNQNIGYIVGNNGYILKSIDSGVTWLQVTTGFNFDFNTVNIINENDIIISSPYALIKSTDGGITWISKNIPNVSVNKTFFLTAMIGHAACKEGTMLKTIDGGENWYITQSTNTFPSDLFTVYFINQNIGFYTKQHNDMFKTIDGGETWTKVNGVSDAIYAFSFVSENIGYATGEYGVIFKTIDGGNTWNWASPQNGRYYNYTIYGIHFLDNNIGYATGARGIILKTSDGGNSWNQNSPTYNDINQLQFLDKNIGYARVGNQLYKTTDSGTNWINIGFLNLGQSVFAGVFKFINENLGYWTTAGTYGGQVYKTTDGGITWVVLNNGWNLIEEGITAISFLDENNGFISGGFNTRKTLKTIDGGGTWQQVLNEKFGQIQFINSLVGYAHRIGYSGGRMYKTIDGGNTWNINVDVDENINRFDFLDENNGYFVGDNSLMYKTKNGGVTWEKLKVPYGYFTFVKFYSKNVGYIFDDYGQLYKTINGGISWKNLTRIDSYGSSSNSISIVEKNIYVGSSNGKILKSTISFDPISIIANPVLNASNNSATLTGSVASNEGLIENIKFEYSTYFAFENNINTNPNSVPFDTSLDFSTTIDNLNPNTTYYYRLKGTYNNIEYTSEEMSFTTLADYVITMNDVYNYSSNTAELTGSITSNKNEISNIEFQYGENEDFSKFSVLSNNTIIAPKATSNVVSNLINLKPETKYYVRMKAVQNGIEIFSSVKSFTTKSEYSISLYNPSINGNNATLSAYIYAYSKDINNIVFEYGSINYENSVATSPNTILYNSSGYVTTTIQNLDPNTNYYYRLKALNGTNIIYSKEGVFNTSGEIILTSSAVKNNNASANLTGLINGYGRYITNIQFEYGITENYGSTLNGTPNYAYGYGTNITTATINDLLPNQIYYYRLKAINNGTFLYSDKFQFNSGILNTSEEIINDSRILLYPNPAQNEVTITLLNEFKNVKRIMVIDILGKVIYSQVNPDLKNNFKINLSNHSKGIYFVKFSFEDNKEITKKLILN